MRGSIAAGVNTCGGTEEERKGKRRKREEIGREAVRAPLVISLSWPLTSLQRTFLPLLAPCSWLWVRRSLPPPRLVPPLSAFQSSPLNINSLESLLLLSRVAAT